MDALNGEAVNRAVRLALEEDIGPGDVTSLATIPADARSRARMRARQPLRLAGLLRAAPDLIHLNTIQSRYRYVVGFVRDDAQVAALGLTPRELEMLVLMAEGLSNREIAERAFVSENTVKTHTSRVLDKLGAARRTQAIQRARELRLVP